MQRPKDATLLFQLALIFFIFVLSLNAQSLPSPRFDGFVYQNSPVDSDTIMIEAFVDPLCPDSRDAWQPLKQALEHYGPRVWLIVHLFPLPYHDNAFVASRALHIVNMLDTSATIKLLEWFFKNQEMFYNAPTRNMSRASIVNQLVNSVTKAFGNSYYSALQSGFNDRKTDLKTRVSFKYGSSRGVFGTPMFFVNGFLLPDAGSAIDFNGWRSIIDPLIKAQSGKSEDSLHFFL